MVHEVVVDTPKQRHHVILRRFVPPAFTEAGARSQARAEAAALERLGTRLTVPRLLAVDPDGAVVGAPATLQTRLRGRTRSAPHDPATWAARLADQLATQQSWDVRRAGLRPFEPRFGEPLEPPAWSRSPEIWPEARRQARDLLAEPHDAGALLHGDFQPGNVLWDHTRLAGVIAWADQCRGPVEVDISRCRVMTALLMGSQPADAFLSHAERALSISYDPRWDLVAACELAAVIDRPFGLHRGRNVTQLRTRLDHVMARSLARG